jgi:hypothetical protein
MCIHCSVHTPCTVIDGRYAYAKFFSFLPCRRWGPGNDRTKKKMNKIRRLAVVQVYDDMQMAEKDTTDDGDDDADDDGC